MQGVQAHECTHTHQHHAQTAQNHSCAADAPGKWPSPEVESLEMHSGRRSGSTVVEDGGQDAAALLENSSSLEVHPLLELHSELDCRDGHIRLGRRSRIPGDVAFLSALGPRFLSRGAVVTGGVARRLTGTGLVVASVRAVQCRRARSSSELEPRSELHGRQRSLQFARNFLTRCSP